THGTDQIIVQRLLAAKSERDSRRALLASGVIVLVQFIVFLLIGVLLYVFAQHSPLLTPGERADRILPLFLVREMPVGLAGLLLGLFLLGTFERGAHARGALAGMIVGLAAILCIFRFTNVAFTWFFMIGSIVTFVVGSIASRISQPRNQGTLGT